MTSVMAPLSIPIEKYVVLPIVDGIAETDTLHLPAARHRFPGQEGQVAFESRIEDGFPPAAWPPACGAFAAGSIYVQGGPLLNRPICSECAGVRERGPEAEGPIVAPHRRRPVAGRTSSRSLTPVRVCTIQGCGRSRLARGWCRMHYGRWVRHGDPMTVKKAGRPGTGRRHGTMSHYKAGCKCDLCREANAAYARRWRERRAA